MSSPFETGGRGPKANLELERAAGHLAQARADYAIGVPGAFERVRRYQLEFDRLRQPLQLSTQLPRISDG